MTQVHGVKVDVVELLGFHVREGEGSVYQQSVEKKFKNICKILKICVLKVYFYKDKNSNAHLFICNVNYPSVKRP